MGDVGSFLLGDTEDAKQVGTAETMLPSQKALLNQINQLLQGQLGKGVQAYPGETVAPATSSQQNVFDIVNQITSGQNMYGMENLIGEYDPTATNEFFKTNVADPAISAWESDIIPKIQEHYISQNAGSSGAANRAITKSGADLTTSLSQSLSEMLYNDRTNHYNQLPDVINNILNMGTGVGGQEYNINQAGLTGDFDQWLSTQGYNNPWLNLMNTALGTTAFQPIVQGPTSTSGLMGTLMSALGSYAGTSSGSQSISNGMSWLGGMFSG